MSHLELFKGLPKSLTVYLPNALAQPNSPAKRASDSGHIWVKNNRAYRYVFDNNGNHLFSGSNDDLIEFYNCSPNIKFS